MKNKITHEIPEGYEARIEGNTVVFEKKKSKEEKIREALIAYFQVPQRDTISIDGVSMSDILSYLEGITPFWTDEDEEFVENILPRILKPDGWTLDQQRADKEALRVFINGLRNRYSVPSEIWNAEDEKHYTSILKDADNGVCLYGGNYDWFKYRFRRIRPQSIFR